ncbi:MAG: N-acetylneuraminate synthase family protein [Candidatus Obscuribacter sp.]|nr:N-acetylneuraminate synthase family protein [Candidatus Obscuribacter sp.]
MAGFSDHTDGITAAIGAVCMGSIWIEKHFTLDHSLPGPDHRFSATSEQFQNLADSVHEMEDMMGNPTLTHTSTESFGRVSPLMPDNYRPQPGHILKDVTHFFRSFMKRHSSRSQRLYSWTPT